MLIPSWLRAVSKSAIRCRTAHRASARLRLDRLESRDVPSLVPLAAEFQVSTNSTFGAAHPAVTMHPDGGFNAVWDERDSDSWGVFARRYNSAGQPHNSPLQINTLTTGSQFVWRRSMASDAIGNSIVVWQSSTSGVYARRFAADGTALGPEFLLNTFPFASGQATEPTVAMNASGRFVATWIDYRNGSWDTYARVFDSAGLALSDEFQVNQFTPGSQYGSLAAIADDGSFVVVWQSSEGSESDIQGRRYASDGTPLGAEFPIPAFSDGVQGSPTVAMDSAGNFVVGWEGPGPGNSRAIFARRFNNTGEAQGPEFVVKSSLTGNQTNPNVAMAPNGNFAFAWGSEDSTSPGLLLRGFNAAGIPQGTQQVVSTNFQGDFPAIAMGSDGDVVVAWQRFAAGSKPNQPSVLRIFARRFEETGPTPPAISIGHIGVAEGNSGSTNASFNVTLSAPSTQTVTVQYLTANGTALAGNDYWSTAGALTFEPGQVTKTVQVPIIGDLVGEPNESFSVNLSNPVNATIADGQGFGTIVDDEPRISIGSVSQNEGNSGPTQFRFTVTLSASFSQTVKMQYRTLNGTASSNGGQADFVAKTGLLEFLPGETQAFIDIIVNGDTKRENGETFSVELFNLSSGNAWFRDNLGEGMIQNDD